MNQQLDMNKTPIGLDHKHRVYSFDAARAGIKMSADMILTVIDQDGYVTKWAVHQHEQRPLTALVGAGQIDWWLKPTAESVTKYRWYDGWRIVTETKG